MQKKEREREIEKVKERERERDENVHQCDALAWKPSPPNKQLIRRQRDDHPID